MPTPNKRNAYEHSRAPPVDLSAAHRLFWAIAFACAISFMGIGLVDPILTKISADLNATPSAGR